MPSAPLGGPIEIEFPVWKLFVISLVKRLPTKPELETAVSQSALSLLLLLLFNDVCFLGCGTHAEAMLPGPMLRGLFNRS